MRAVIFTLGTRGDVQPYVALAKKLVQCGHSASICTGESFRNLVEASGASFVRTPSDLMAIAQTEEGKAVLEHPVRNLGKAMRLAREVMNPAYRKTLDVFFAAAGEADCILYHPKALGAVDIALYYGIPCVSMPPVPITYPIPEFPNLAITTRNLGHTLNRLSYQVNAKAESSQMAVINDFRQGTLHLGKRKAGIYAFQDGRKEIPTVYPVSRHLFPEVRSWEGHVFLPGFFFLEEEGESIPEGLEEFLAAGEKPIAVTFSSMPLSRPEVFWENLCIALRETGNRAVLLTGNSGLGSAGCIRDGLVYACPFLPHQWLFGLVKGVIHHGGAGTMAAALKAGIPQLIMPFSADQPFWAKRLSDLGVGLGAIREKEVSAQGLAEQLRLMEDPSQLARVEDLARKIRGEQGTEETVRYLEKLVDA